MMKLLLILLVIPMVYASIELSNVTIGLESTNISVTHLNATNLTLGDDYYFLEGYLVNLYSGWNLVPQGHSYARNFSNIYTALGDNITVLSYYNSTNQTFRTYVPGIYGNLTVPGRSPYFAYSQVNKTVNISYNYSLKNYTLNVSWQLLLEDQPNGETLGTINNSIGNKSIVLSYFNNTDKKFRTTIPFFTMNKDVVVPFLNTFYAYINSSTRWER